MSFCVVPASVDRGAPCSSATATYSASSHMAGALIVIEVLASASGMPSNSVRMSPMWLDRHPDPADLTPGQLVVGVVPGLGGQVERDREPGLPLGQVAPVQRVGRLRPRNDLRRSASPTADRAPGRSGTAPDTSAIGAPIYVRSTDRRVAKDMRHIPSTNRTDPASAVRLAWPHNGPMADQATRLFVLFGGLLLMGVLMLALRWTFGTGHQLPGPADPGPGGPDRRRPAEEVSRVPTQTAAEVLRSRLGRAGIRATIGRADGGYRLLVFADDLVPAKLVLRQPDA